ncbi:MAG: cytochrome C [Desulfuromonas sp.]|nr:MAG: cytochrome C [Desulfuromonas sp.]
MFKASYSLPALVAILFLIAASPALAEPSAALSIQDCVKCHDQQPAEIEAAGAAHKEAINCLECHTAHRPRVENNIPECGMCHDGEKHFELSGCLNCHNPHSPLDVTLEGELKQECLTCHTSQNEQMVASPSYHAEASCNFCHADKHGVIPQCVDCHESHSEQITQNDCQTCHAAHKPLELAYADTTPSVQCGACHDGVLSMLQASKAKHSAVGCVECHADKHKTIPQCSDCHGLPHPEGMHAKFPKCGECHNIAHDLNNWPNQDK